MKKLLVIVDMQNDFVTGCLGTEEAKQIIPDLKKYAESFDGDIVFTQDTHHENYMETQEGQKLPVVHCIEGSEGWQIVPELQELAGKAKKLFCKPVFGSVELGEFAKDYEEVYLCGVCTGICVLSNAVLIRSFNPEVNINVLGKLCACVTPESHEIALKAMKTVQVDVKE